MGIIRFLLAIAVVFSHSSSLFGLDFVGGKLAVELFYIISGFYMALILTEKYIGLKSYKLFITNRMLKLYPTYWTVAILTLVFCIVAGVSSGGESWGKLQAFNTYWSQMPVSAILFLVLSNIIIFFQDAIMSLGFDIQSGTFFFLGNSPATYPKLYNFLLVPQAWTIAIELMFYLVAPFIARKSIKLISILILLSIAIKVGLAYSGYSDDPWSYRFFPSELHLFLVGILAYRAYLVFKEKSIESKYLYCLLIANIALIIACGFVRELLGAATDYIYMLIFLFSLPFIFMLSKNWRIDSKIGELSYPIYICHIFVISIIGYLNISNVLGSFGLMAAVLSVLLSLLINRFVYSRIEKFRQARAPKN